MNYALASVRCPFNDFCSEIARHIKTKLFCGVSMLKFVRGIWVAYDKANDFLPLLRDFIQVYSHFAIFFY